MPTATKRMTTIRNAWIWNVPPERPKVKAGTPKWDTPTPTVPTPETPPNPKPIRTPRPEKPTPLPPSLEIPVEVGTRGFRADKVAALLDCTHNVRVTVSWVRGRQDGRGYRYFCGTCNRVMVIKGFQAVPIGS